MWKKDICVCLHDCISLSKYTHMYMHRHVDHGWIIEATLVKLWLNLFHGSGIHGWWKKGWLQNIGSDSFDEKKWPSRNDVSFPVFRMVDLSGSSCGYVYQKVVKVCEWHSGIAWYQWPHDMNSPRSNHPQHVQSKWW